MSYDNFEIVYNGEVYNFKEIRLELEKYNYFFNSDSDTEVILKAYHKWGIKAVDKFNGMFAISIYDKNNKKLVLIRDRSGVKPLYYYFKDDVFLFASELKSFYEYPYFKKDLNIESVALFLQMGFIPEPYAIFKDTFKLKSGHYLELDIKNKQINEVCYWNILDFYKKDKIIISENEAIKEVEKLMQSAFEYRMVSDVPVGIFLSGGYDSSLVTAQLQHNRTQKLNTFTIGFHEKKYNEANYAKEIAKYLGTNHTEQYINFKDAQETISLLPEIYDEPFGDQSAIPTILVSKLAKQSVTVSLSADGGDEIFGGYNKYTDTYPKTKKVANILSAFFTPKQICKVAYHLQNSGLTNKPSFESNVAKIVFENSDSMTNLVSYSTAPTMIEKLIPSYKYKRIITNFDLINELDSLSEIDKMLALDYKTYMVDDILHKVDRATMSVSLEGREPLLDHRIIEYVARLDSKLKIKNGDKKWLLKQVTHKYIPKKMMDRPKKGFSIPIHIWLKNDLKEYMEEYFSHYDSGILCKNELEKIKELFYKDKANFQMVWHILAFQMWHKRWMS
jgi:asparagine synthase (glutamine-hydrolysing)